ncbi:MAG TPA: sugar isomerase, partial [Niabella sp.]|nr:sugar isomerase [Niabella sp.]
MILNKSQIDAHNEKGLVRHKKSFDYIAGELADAEGIIKKLVDFQVAIPSWALGNGGTRFGRFSGGGEPATLEEKMEDIG